VVVVPIGLITSAELPLPKAFGMLRMMRAFRVFRLFKRVPALNKIIGAIVRAIPGVMHAFLILTIAMCIYAILAVELFRLTGRGEEDAKCKVVTARGYCLGEEYFGTFSKSFYSMFQVLTGDSWSEAISRPAFFYYEDEPMLMFGTQFFFMTFILVNAIVLINVVVAVLLDKMVDNDAPAKKGPEEGNGEECMENGEAPAENGEESLQAVGNAAAEAEDGDEFLQVKEMAPAASRTNHTGMELQDESCTSPAGPGHEAGQALGHRNSQASVRVQLVAIQTQLGALSTELRADVAATRGEVAEMRWQLSELLAAVEALTATARI